MLTDRHLSDTFDGTMLVAEREGYFSARSG
jgi:hypothetical protein